MGPKIFAASLLFPVSSPPIEGGALVIDGGRIVAVGRTSDITAAYSGQVTEFPDCIILPGLVNAHSHLELTHFPSWKIRKGIDYTPRTYMDWIIQVIKIMRALTLHELEQSVLEGIRISMESGTTALGEIVSDQRLLPLYQRSPLAGRVYLEAIGQEPQRCESVLSSIAEGISGFTSAAELGPGISPHAPHTLSTAFLGNVRAFAEQHSLRMAIHLAETTDELDFLFDSTGPIAEKLYPFVGWERYLPAPRRTTPTAFLDGLGILGNRTLAAHCVHVTPADAEILKRRNTAVVICPRSNEKLDVGKVPVHLLKKAGIVLALGTDSLASNDSLSLFDEARFLLDTFPGEFVPAEVLRMITLSGAEAIGVDARVGSLEQGKRADFLLMELPLGHAGSDIYESIIRGGRLLEVYARGKSVYFPDLPKAGE
jgi:aminodeoxyfutalosine deaminase